MEGWWWKASVAALDGESLGSIEAGTRVVMAGVVVAAEVGTIEEESPGEPAQELTLEEAPRRER